MTRTLPLQPLSRAAFAAFGDVIDTGSAAEEFDINDGLTRRYHDISRAQALGDSASVGFSLFRARAVTLPFTLQRMERHPLGSQAFINVNSVACAIVVAPAGEFDVDQMRAFLAAPGHSINYRAGTWHHYLLALGRGDFVVVDRIGEGDNCEEIALPEPILLTAADHAQRA